MKDMQGRNKNDQCVNERMHGTTAAYGKKNTKQLISPPYDPGIKHTNAASCRVAATHQHRYNR